MDSPISRKKQFYHCQCDFAHIRVSFFNFFQYRTVLSLFTAIENQLSTPVHVENRE